METCGSEAHASGHLASIWHPSGANSAKSLPRRRGACSPASSGPRNVPFPGMARGRLPDIQGDGLEKGIDWERRSLAGAAEKLGARAKTVAPGKFFPVRPTAA